MAQLTSSSSRFPSGSSSQASTPNGSWRGGSACSALSCSVTSSQALIAANRSLLQRTAGGKGAAGRQRARAPTSGMGPSRVLPRPPAGRHRTPRGPQDRRQPARSSCSGPPLPPASAARRLGVAAIAERVAVGVSAATDHHHAGLSEPQLTRQPAGAELGSITKPAMAAAAAAAELVHAGSSSRGIGPAQCRADSAMAFTATAGVAGLTIGVPLAAGLAAEQQGAVAERCFRLDSAVASRASALKRGGSLQGRGHGLSLLRAAKPSLAASAWASASGRLGLPY